MIGDILWLAYAYGVGYVYRAVREDSVAFDPLPPVLALGVALVWPVVVPLSQATMWWQVRKWEKAKAEVLSRVGALDGAEQVGQ